jgi:hypothetical protein
MGEKYLTVVKAIKIKWVNKTKIEEIKFSSHFSFILQCDFSSMRVYSFSY